MKLLLTGRKGQLGFELARTLAPLGDVLALDRGGCDLSDPDSIRRAIQSYKPDVIVNAAAYTAVDRAESRPDDAHAINAHAVGVIGEEAQRINARVIHYSTDYVFDGTASRPYTELDTPNPLSVYGRSKLAGELALQRSGASYLILRTSWVVGAHGSNFVRTILRLARERDRLDVVDDQLGAPTSAAMLAQVTASILPRLMQEPNLAGLYHLTASGETSWFRLAKHVLRTAIAHGELLRTRPESVVPISSSAYAAAATRPLNSRLDCTKLRTAFGIELPHWATALQPVLDEILRTP